MIEFAFEGFPDTLPAGKTEVEVVNEGAQFHLMFVQTSQRGRHTAEQVSQHLERDARAGGAHRSAVPAGWGSWSPATPGG